MNEDLAAQLNRRVAETVAWCSCQPFVKNVCTPGDLAYICQLETAQLAGPRSAADPPISILRTPALQPPDLLGEATTFTARRVAIEMLAKARAFLLRERSAYPPAGKPQLGRGRFLLYSPDLSSQSGAALVASSGFFSWQDAPPWDTWIILVRQAAATSSSDPTASYLLSWVPPNLVEVADAGIHACSEQGLRWVEEGDPAVIHFLRYAGLMP